MAILSITFRTENLQNVKGCTRAKNAFLSATEVMILRVVGRAIMMLVVTLLNTPPHTHTHTQKRLLQSPPSQLPYNPRGVRVSVVGFA